MLNSSVHINRSIKCPIDSQKQRLITCTYLAGCLLKPPGALISPEHYNIESDVARLKELLDRMNDRSFLQKEDNTVENKAWTIPELNVFYTHSIRNEESIRKSNLCGCFHCISISPVADVKLSEMVVEKDCSRTAICPICGIDAVLGDASVEITAEILEVLNEHFF